MRIHPLLARHPQSSQCITCPDPAPCNCAANQDCFLINRDCQTCSSFKCVAKAGTSTGSSSKGGSNPASLAGAVVGSLIFLALAILLFTWYRRRTASKASKRPPPIDPKDIPAAAEDVLNRPDPTEKPITPIAAETNFGEAYYGGIADPEAAQQTASHRYSTATGSVKSNPFSDKNSIQTAGTEGSNVIPIALVAAQADRPTSSGSNGPHRPPRSPDLNLNLEHVNMSRETLAPYATSQISGISGMSRQSYLSSASYASDFLNEAPMIVSSQGAVRQVLGVVKAEMVHAPGSGPSTPRSPNSLQLPPSATRSMRSPLASSSFGPSDMMREEEEEGGHNPFADSDSNSNIIASHHASVVSDWNPENPNLPFASSRPTSMSTQAGSIAEFGNATRVYVGQGGGPSDPLSPYKTAMGRLVTPSSSGLGPGQLQEQQKLAIAHAQAQAQRQGFDKRRISGSSAITAASMGADSILESFPFVPPSPISNLPMRTPPATPSTQHTFGDQSKEPRTPTQAHPQPPPSPMSPLEPPNRKLLGMSTGSHMSTSSQVSTASNGLGSFEFEIGSANVQSNPPPGLANRQRASLDTLAITNDLTSYPLGFDQPARDSFDSRKN